MDLNKYIKLTPFQKLCFTTKEHKELLQYTIKEISQAVQEAEIDSVALYQRPCSWQTRRLRSLPEFSKKCMDKGLIVYPIKLVGKWDSGFIHYTPALDPKDPDPNVYCIVSSRIENAKAFEKAFRAGDHISQGELLGFPSCCTKFFTEQWGKGYFDPIWQLATPDDYRNSGHTSIRWTDWHPYSNPLLRYIGLRIGFHIPCSLTCQKTIEVATERIKLIEDKNLRDILVTILYSNMDWIAHMGILEVKTEYFYILTQTVPCVEKHIVSLKRGESK